MSGLVWCPDGAPRPSLLSRLACHGPSGAEFFSRAVLSLYCSRPKGHGKEPAFHWPRLGLWSAAATCQTGHGSVESSGCGNKLDIEPWLDGCTVPRPGRGPVMAADLAWGLPQASRNRTSSRLGPTLRGIPGESVHEPTRGRPRAVTILRASQPAAWVLASNPQEDHLLGRGGAGFASWR